MPAAPAPSPADLCGANGVDDIWHVACDGSASPNPGRMGLGALITAPDGTEHSLSIACADRGCNNEAEVRAVMAALVELRRLGVSSAVIQSDNSIVVAQLGGAGATATVAPIARLAALFDEARALLAQAGDVRLRWVPRHRNQRADALSRAAVGLAPKVDTAGSKKNGKRRR